MKFSVIFVILMVMTLCHSGQSQLVGDVIGTVGGVVGTVGKTVKGLGDLVGSAVGTVGEALKNILELNVPGLLTTTINAIGGYPPEVASTFVGQACSSLLNFNGVLPLVTPDITKMKFRLMTACGDYSVPLTQAEQLVDLPEFDPLKKLVIFATGWRININGSEMLNNVAKAYACRNDTNFVAVDAANFIDTFYTWSAFNTRAVGEYIAVGLQRFKDKIPLENIHLIGHSLGAHIVGYAGRSFTALTGQTVPRITGLDPAKPCFQNSVSLDGLKKEDADFVDIIHTDPGILGDSNSRGHVDFYPGGVNPLAAGTLSFIESHGRAGAYYAESVYPGNEDNFEGARCTTALGLNLGICVGVTSSMGYATPTTSRGDYLLNVNGKSPFGKNLPTATALRNMQCGLCANN